LLREIWNAAPESSSDVEAILALVLPPR